MSLKSTITEEDLYKLCHELLEYKDGTLYRKVHQNKARQGDKAGCKTPYGYIRIKMKQDRYMEHRLVWLMHYGKLPKELDHINRNRSDNRIENLRECNRSQNVANASRRSDNTSDFIGIYKSNNKWVASITKEQKSVFRKAFILKEEAIAAYQAKHAELFGEFSPYFNKKKGN